MLSSTGEITLDIFITYRTSLFEIKCFIYFRANPAQTHRLIPWLNRELVALMPAWNASVIPEILEQMRDYLLDHDIQAESTKNYFLRYLHANTTHFLHEFHNYAVSPYDMVGYDRIVEYNGRPLNSHGAGFSDAGVITVSSSDSSSSSDSEDIRVVDEERSTEVTIEADNCMVVTSIANGANISNNDALNDIGGSNHATGGSLYRNTNDVSTSIATGNVSVSSDDSDSEVQFVLARKPPHLRTPEQVTLDSASDSDVIYIANSPNEPAVIDSSDTSDNEPLSKTVKRLKSEHSDPMINEQKPITQPMLDMPTLDLPIETFNIYNFGASTSNSFKNMHPKKMYCKPNRKRSIGKSIYEKSSSETSGSSSNNDGDWYVNSANNSNTKKKVSKKAKKSTKSSKKRKDSERKHKKRRTESSSNVVPLTELISTELRNDKEPDIANVAEEIVVVSNTDVAVIPSESSDVIVPVNETAKPKIKSVVIRKSGNQQHYIEQPNQSSSSSTSSNSNTEDNDIRLYVDESL